MSCIPFCPLKFYALTIAILGKVECRGYSLQCDHIKERTNHKYCYGRSKSPKKFVYLEKLFQFSLYLYSPPQQTGLSSYRCRQTGGGTLVKGEVSSLGSGGITFIGQTYQWSDQESMKSWASHLLTVWLWASPLFSLEFNIPSCWGSCPHGIELWEGITCEAGSKGPSRAWHCGRWVSHISCSFAISHREGWDLVSALGSSHLHTVPCDKFCSSRGGSDSFSV